MAASLLSHDIRASVWLIRVRACVCVCVCVCVLVGNVVWFDEMSAARAMLKLSRSSNDADLHQFITSSLSSSSSASAASNTNTTSTSRVTAVTVVFSVASAFLYLLVMYDINHFAAMAVVFGTE